MTTRISVCVPVWNDADWLPGAIESVLAQEHQDWELIVGDNASEPDLGEIVARYPDPRIRYQRWQQHTDLWENFNRTSQLSCFEWVQPLCADDRLTRDCLAKIAERIEAAQAQCKRLSVVLTDCDPVDTQGRPAGEAYYGHRSIIRPEDGTYSAEQWLDLMAQPSQPPWNLGSIAFNREMMVASGWFRPEIGYAADLEAVLRLAAYGDVVYINEKLLLFTVRDVSDSLGRALQVLRDGERVTPMEFAWNSALRAHARVRPVSKTQRSKIRKLMARSHMQLSLQHRLWRDGLGRRGAARDVWRAVSLSPRLLLSPRHVGEGLLAILAPRWAIELALQRLTTHRRGVAAAAGTPWRP